MARIGNIQTNLLDVKLETITLVDTVGNEVNVTYDMSLLSAELIDRINNAKKSNDLSLSLALDFILQVVKSWDLEENEPLVNSNEYPTVPITKERLMKLPVTILFFVVLGIVDKQNIKKKSITT